MCHGFLGFQMELSQTVQMVLGLGYTLLEGIAEFPVFSSTLSRLDRFGIRQAAWVREKGR